MAGLAVFGFVQAKLASDRANIALARQLASQAQLLNNEDDSKQMIASLLSVQSLRLFPNAEATTFLMNQNFAAQQIQPHKIGACGKDGN